jgi:hypothetical protein
MTYCYLFPAKLLMLKGSNRPTMAGVLELIMCPQKRLIVRSGKAPWVDPRVMELQTAMEILAEVFGIGISEVEEMLMARQRGEVEVQSCSREGALWPESFCLAE